MGREKGFIGTIVLVVIALFLLKYLFNFNILEVFTSEKGKETWEYVRTVLSTGWNYLRDLVITLVGKFRS